MAISINNYVDITSGVGAGAVATTRSLVGRLFTDNTLLPPGTFVTFSTAAGVAAYFGSASEEYLRAVFYFSWVSKNTTSPQSIQFARWADVATAPKVYSAKNNNPSLTLWQAVSDGSFGITIDGEAETLSSLSFSSPSPVGSLAAVAGIVQNAIRGTHSSFQEGVLNSTINVTGLTDTTLTPVGSRVIGDGIPSGATVATIVSSTAITLSVAATATETTVLQFFAVADIQWGLATVTYNSITGSFDFVGGATGDADISIQAGVSGTDITAVRYLGWRPQAANDGQGNLVPSTGAIWSAGSAVESITDTLNASADASNNFGSFLFLNSLNLTNDEIIEAATWNAAENVLYLYTVPVDESNAATLHNSLQSIGGVALTLSLTAGEYPEQVPMMIEAATDYAATNAVQNYMYQLFPGLTPSVTTDGDAAGYDAASINYYGSTQTAGQIISFYQRGLLQGGLIPTNITDMNAYVNEIWLKDAAAVALLNMFLGLAQVAANAQGRSQVLATIQAVINQALVNGTISVGKTLNSAQQAFITNETNDNKAWYQVQNSGYWVDCVIELIPNTTQYQAHYTLIYSKDDVIRKVVGTQTLIQGADMQNISGFGLIVNVIASKTFPFGLPITQFSDDSDPLDVPSLQIGDSAMGLNGDLVVWSKANPVKATLNILPNTIDDVNLSILFEANRVGRGKIGARDVITMTILYPSGNFVTLINGFMTDGTPSSSVASAGRLKTKNYNFTFEGRIGA